MSDDSSLVGKCRALAGDVDGLLVRVNTVEVALREVLELVDELELEVSELAALVRED